MRMFWVLRVTALTGMLLVGAGGCGFSADDKQHHDGGQDTVSDRQGLPQDVTREVGLICADAGCTSCPATAPTQASECPTLGQSCEYWDPNPEAKNPYCHCVDTDAGVTVWNCSYQL